MHGCMHEVARLPFGQLVANHVVVNAPTDSVAFNWHLTVKYLDERPRALYDDGDPYTGRLQRFVQSDIIGPSQVYAHRESWV